MFCCCLFAAAHAQHSADQISYLMLKMDSKYKKYDSDDRFDSLYRMENQYLAEAEDVMKKMQRSEAYVEVDIWDAYCAEVAIWHAYRAATLTKYAQISYWRIYERTEGADANPDDPKTWDLNTLVSHIIQDYHIALKYKDVLVKIPATAYTKMFNITSETTYIFSLYDLLAYRFADFAANQNLNITLPEQTFQLNHAEFFNDELPTLSTPNSLSFHYHFLSIMKDIQQIHQNDSNPNALIYSKLYRYNYLNGNANIKNGDSLYLAALLRLVPDTSAKGIVYQTIYQNIGAHYCQLADKSEIPSDNYRKAIEWLQLAVNAAPETTCARSAKELIHAIEYPNISAVVSNIIYPENNLFSIVTKNCDTVYAMVITQVDDIYAKKKFKITTHWQQTIAIQNGHLYYKDSTLAVMPQLPPGKYTLLLRKTPFSSDKEMSSAEYAESTTQEFIVTRLHYRYVSRDGKLYCWVVDSKTGAPLFDVSVKLKYKSNKLSAYDYEEIHKTDLNGLTVFNENKFAKKRQIEEAQTRRASNSLILSVYYLDDKRDDESIGFDRDHDRDYTLHGTIFTDRKIYRPGQKVQWKAVLSELGQYDSRIATEQEIIVIVSADNGNLLQRDTIQVNEFGSAAGEFEITNNCYLGSYRITLRTKNRWLNAVDFRVEEYKQPTFEVAMNAPTQTYRLNDSVTVTGDAKAFAGYAVQGATVTYEVTRRLYFPFHYRNWWLCPYQARPQAEVAHGEVTTDENGRFNISFLAQEGDDDNRFCPAYIFEINVTVTDISGETHDATTSVNISNRTLILKAELPKTIHANSDRNHFPVQATNLSDKPQNINIQYVIKSLKTPDQYKMESPFKCKGAGDLYGKHFPQFAFNGEEDPQNWAETAIVASGEIASSDSSFLEIPGLAQLPTGAYRLYLSARDTFGQELEENYFFYIAHQHLDFPEYVPLSIEANKPSWNIGDKAVFTIGSNLKNQNVLIQIYNNDKLLEEKWIKLNQSCYQYSHSVKAGEEGALVCEAYTTWEGQDYVKTWGNRIIDLSHHIDFEFITFRDKVQPGATETVKMILKDNHEHAVSKAELLCTMYDASLDAFVSNSYRNQYVFGFNHPSPPYIYHANTGYVNKRNGKVFYSRASYRRLFPPNWSTFLNIQWERRISVPGRSIAECADFGVVDGVMLTYAVEESAPLNGTEYVYEAVLEADVARKTGIYEGDAIAEEPVAEEPVAEEPVAIRTNFAETAFFYPFLRTNEKGEIEMEYTIPESLTKWKMMGFAYSQDLRQGSFEKTVLTQKEVMVVPNAPRFIYEGDQLQFAAKVINLGSDKLAGTAELQIFNTETDEEILIENQSITLEKESTIAVKFKVEVPMGLTALTYRIIVRAKGNGGTFSDGEENVLPVLSRRQLVTETMPIFITKKGSKTFSLKNLPAATQNIINCKLLFTPDPKWNVVLALPYLMEYPYDCNEQLFSKLYANSIAEYICAQNPQLQTLLQNTFDNQPDALRSKLEQNNDLKQILLAETPWIRDAQDQDNEIQNIFCLFDTKNVDAERKSMVKKITQNQNSDGGWHWFSRDDKYPSDRYITQHILIGSGRLIEKNVCNTSDNFLSENTLRKAVNFIDNDIEKEYRELKKANADFAKDNQLHSGIIHYLYARSFYLNSKHPTSEAYKFYEGQLVKYASEIDNIYLKTMAALTLYKEKDSKKKTLAQKLMNNIKEQAIHSEEFGMYWKKSGDGYYWSDALIERQALLIEAFETILQDEESVKEMKIWMLQQKRTQHWGTTRATVDACHALLIDEDEQATTTGPAHIRVAMCDETVEFADTLQAPTKHDLASCVEKGSNGDIVVSRDNDGLAYGGVFVQYYQDITEMASTGTDIPLSVERKLYRVELTERGESLKPITAKTPLSVGEKVRVRMKIRCDRDLEYVHLKDLRAAAFEPTETLSGHRWQDGLWYYQSFRDASVNFFFDHIYKGTYIFEYTLYATQSGTFCDGYASIQCMYAPEFCAHSASDGKINIK